MQLQRAPNLHTARLRLLSLLFGYVVVSVGVMVLIGWMLNIDIVKSVLPGLATMKFNTALLFLFAGIALITARSARRVSQVCAILVMIIAGLTLAEYSFGWSLSIDETVVRDAQTVVNHGDFPGRMSIMTGISFVLIGGSLLLVLARRVLGAHLLALIAGMLALLALIGYTYDVDALYQIFSFSSMALHTALAFFLLALGILFVEPESGVMQIVVNDSSGGLLMRRLLPAAILLPLLYGILRLQGEKLGLYSGEFGSALTTLAYIVTFTLLIGWTARYLQRADTLRLAAEAERQQAYDEMEQRVAERTAELAQANQTLQISEERFAGVLNTAHDAVISIDDQQRIILFNQGAERIFGYQADEALGQHLEMLMPERFSQQHPQFVADFGATESATRIMAPDRPELLGRRKNGKEFPTEVSISSLTVNGERIYTAVLRDVTERWQAQRALAESEERYRLLVNSISDYAIYALDPNGKITTWTESARRIKGYTSDEIVGQDYSIFYTPDDQATGLPQSNLEIAARVGNYEGAGWRIRKDGSRFWAEVVITAMRDEDGELIGFSKITRDLTERKQAEEAVRRNERLLSAVLDSLPVGVWITDPSGTIIRGNPAVHEIWAGARYVGVEEYGEYKAWWLNTGDLIAADDWAAARAIRLGETSINEEIEIECFDKTHKYILNSGIPIRDDQQNIAGAVIVNQDITNLKEIESRLRDSADALERNNQELQTFVYTASHDLQEPLRKIQAFGDRLQTLASGTLSDKESDYLSRMINASFRMQALIQDLLAYSRVSTVKQPFRRVNLNKVVDAVRLDLEVAVENNQATIVVEPLMTIEADETQMRQLFQNLISNAIKFSAEGRPAVIHISGRLLDLPEQTSGKIASKPQQYEITVADNGIGFEQQYAERIFGMFQRLHGRTQFEGTGIGLAICHRIVTRHHGTIRAEGALSEGATFIITIPTQQVQTEIRSS